MKEQIIYFEKAGAKNTASVLDLVKDAASAKGITKIVLASTRGDTAKAAADALQGSDLQLIVVPWQYGFGHHHKLGAQPFPQNLVKELEQQGHRVHFGTMLFHTDKLYGSNVPGAIANALRILGQGIKVCVEILMMAADGGCLEKGEKVIAVAGTGAGADTAVIATAAPSLQMSVLRIHEILCKPL
jgi:hypothetical protein